MKTIVSVTTLAVLVLGIAPIAMAVPNSNSIIEDGIEYYIQTDKSIYDLGENVEMLYRVTNLRSEEWRFGYSFPIGDAIVAAKEGEVFNEIWHWSWDKIHPMGPIVFQLGPGESAELNGIWPQIDLNGSVEIEDHTQVPPGMYKMMGVFYPTDSYIVVDMTIIPEPATLSLLGLGAVILKNLKNKKTHFPVHKF
jgi:hypothetical protein